MVSRRIAFMGMIFIFMLGYGIIWAASSTSATSSVAVQVDKSAGNVPFSVVFTAKVKLGKGVTVINYNWDFDSNGKIDLNTTINPTASFTYMKTGTYTATVTVVLSNKKSVSAKVQITASAPSSSVLIMSPANNQILSGDTPVVVWVDQSKIVIQRIEFWSYDDTVNDLKLIETQAVSANNDNGKYNFIWRTNADAQNGHKYYIFARVFDSKGFYLGSPTVYVAVKNAPATQILSPADNSNASGKVPVTVEAHAANPSYPLDRIELWATDETENMMELIFTFPIKEPAADNKYKIIWNTNTNGKDNHAYYLYVKVFDTAGNGQTSPSVYVKVKNSPSAAIESPANNATVSGIVPLVLNAIPASPDFPIKKIEFYSSDVKVNINQLLETRTIDEKPSGQKYIFNWNTTTQARNGFRYKLYFIVYDAANNSYAASPVYLAVNNTPATMIVSPQDRFTASGNVEVVVEAFSPSPSIAIKKIEFYGIDEELNAKLLLGSLDVNTEDPGKRYKFIWKTNTQAQSNHHYYLFFMVSDAYGNTSNSDSIYVTVKNNPAGSILYPSPNQKVSGVVDVRVAAQAANKDFPLKRIELWSNDTVSNIKRLAAQSDLKSPSADGVYTIPWDTTQQSPNRYELYTVIYDAAQNQFNSAPVPVNVDNSPSALLLSPASGDDLSGQVEVKIEAHAASPQFPLKKIELRGVDQFTNQTLVLETLNLQKEEAGDQYTFVWDTSRVQSSRKYSIYARVYDQKENYINSNDVMVRVNNIPVVNLVSPMDKMFVSGTVDIKFTAHAVIKNQVIKKAEVWIRDVATAEQKKVVDYEFAKESSNGAYTLKWDCSKDVANGEKYYLFVRVYDSLDNYYTTPDILIMIKKGR